MIFNFFDCSSPFCFLLIEFHCTLFPFLIKYYHVMFNIIVFRLASDKLPVVSQDFFHSLPRDQLWDVTPRLGVSVILE